MSYVKALKCRECGRAYPKDPIYVCEFCFGSLEVDYDYEAIRKVFKRSEIERGPRSLWRYAALLPIDGEPTVGIFSGWTPLIRADNLAKALAGPGVGANLGVRPGRRGQTDRSAPTMFIKDDSVCHPTLSFKDRVVAVALSKAKEFGFEIAACASTGNLANSVAALAARAGLERYIFIPTGLESAKVLSTLIYQATLIAVDGTYDEVNRLCSEIASKYGWAFVNINIRPYYAEGSKTLAFEVIEQLGWQAPDHFVVPAAGGSLITKIWKALKELKMLGLIGEVRTKVHCAQPEGCSPIASAILENAEFVRPVKNPNTICKSLAIGNPADGYYAKDAVQASSGTAAIASDEEIRDGIKLLAETEGIFTETAGGVTVSAARKLIQSGVIRGDESVVLAITGNGLKTQEAIQGEVGKPIGIQASLASFEERIEEIQKGKKGQGGDAWPSK